MSGAQCSPPRTAMPYPSESSCASSSELIFALSKAKMPQRLGRE